MKIQILGPGCQKCQKLTANVEAAVGDIGRDCEIEKVTDIQKIIDFGVMMTPALVIDGDVRSSGKVLSVDELKRLLSEAREDQS